MALEAPSAFTRMTTANRTMTAASTTTTMIIEVVAILADLGVEGWVASISVGETAEQAAATVVTVAVAMGVDLAATWAATVTATATGEGAEADPSGYQLQDLVAE